MERSSAEGEDMEEAGERKERGATDEFEDEGSTKHSGTDSLRGSGTVRHAGLEEGEEEESTKKAEPQAAGLSSEQLEELHKTDPKRVKRILANRSSAARSKVRKLRYIAELDSKSAALQQQMSEMTAELRTLQENTVRIGSENEWLLSQLVALQEQSSRLDQETQTLEGHLRQSLATSQTQGPRLVAGVERNPSVNSFPSGLQPPPLPQQPPPLPQHGRIPESAFTGLQDQGQQASLQFPRRQILPSTLPVHPSFAAVTSHFRGPGEAFNPLLPDPHTPAFPVDSQMPQMPPYPDAAHPFGIDHPGAALTTLNSYNGSDGSGSGLSSTTQELRLQPDDPTLLTLLRSFDLGPRRASGPSGLPYPSGLNQYARSISLGMPSRLQHQRPFGGAPVRAIDPGRMISLPQMAQMGLLDPRRAPPAPEGGGYEPTLPLSAGLGLAAWPRHASEPPGNYQWPPRRPPQ